MNQKLISQMQEVQNVFKFLTYKESERKAYFESLKKNNELLEKYKKDKWNKLFPFFSLIKFVFISGLCSLTFGYVPAAFIYDTVSSKQSLSMIDLIIYSAVIIEAICFSIYFLIRLDYKISYIMVKKKKDKDSKKIQLIDEEEYQVYKEHYHLIKFIPKEDRYIETINKYIETIKSGEANNIYESRKRIEKNTNIKKVNMPYGWKEKIDIWDKEIMSLAVEPEHGKIELRNEVASGLKKWLEVEGNLSNNEDNRIIQNRIKCIKRGISGEESLAFELKKCSLNMQVLFDILIYDEDMDITAEIDCICISENCIFLIECKNINGDIHQDSKGQIIIGSQKRYSMYSPIKQVEDHLKILESALKKFNLYSKIKNRFETLVVFANPNKIIGEIDSFKCLRLEQLNEYLEEINNTSMNDFLNKQEIEAVVKKILQMDEEARKNKEAVSKNQTTIKEIMKAEFEVEETANDYINLDEKRRLEAMEHYCASLSDKDIRRVEQYDWRKRQISGAQIDKIKKLLNDKSNRNYFEMKLREMGPYLINEDITMLEADMLIKWLQDIRNPKKRPLYDRVYIGFTDEQKKVENRGEGQEENTEEIIPIFIDTETISQKELEEGDIYEPEGFEI